MQIINRVAQALTGWSEEEAVGKPLEEVFSIINERTREKCENPVAKVLQNGEIVGLANHTALISKDGGERSIADSAAPIRDAAGKITGVVLVFRDVTESKRMEDSLARLASFPMLNPSPVMEADFSGHIHYLNPAIETLVSRPRGARTGASLDERLGILRPRLPRRRADEHHARSLHRRTLLSANGALRPRYGTTSASTGWTSRCGNGPKKLQAHEKANLQSIFDVVNVGMLLIDESGAVRRVNNTVSRWLGKDLDGTSRRCNRANWWDASMPSAIPRGADIPRIASFAPFATPSNRCCAPASPSTTWRRQRRSSIEGKEVEFWLEASADPLLLDGRRHVVLALNDITARKRVEESLQRTAEELARSNQDLEQFAYVASHDLQEPLRMVAGYLQLLEDRYKGQLDEKADKYIAYAVDGAERMSGLIRDLLAFSRVNSRGEELCEVDSQKAFESALRNLGSVDPGKRGRNHARSAADGPRRLDAIDASLSKSAGQRDQVPRARPAAANPRRGPRRARSSGSSACETTASASNSNTRIKYS